MKSRKALRKRVAAMICKVGNVGRESLLPEKKRDFRFY
jgi:hypothetical protein